MLHKLICIISNIYNRKKHFCYYIYQIWCDLIKSDKLALLGKKKCDVIFGKLPYCLVQREGGQVKKENKPKKSFIENNVCIFHIEICFHFISHHIYVALSLSLYPLLYPSVCLHPPLCASSNSFLKLSPAKQSFCLHTYSWEFPLNYSFHSSRYIFHCLGFCLFQFKIKKIFTRE